MRRTRVTALCAASFLSYLRAKDNEMNIAVVKYNAGNVRSVLNALERLGVTANLTDSPDELRNADKVIFPGQGEASTTMAHLRQTGLAQVIRSLRNPVLGICVGMQLLCAHSEEGDVDCLGVFDAPVKRFPMPKPNPLNLKVPQMGWNSVHDVGQPLFSADMEGAYVYCIHSFYVPVCQHTIATSTHTVQYSNALRRDNFFATQFHPEKSGSVGEKILRNFIEL